MAWHWIPRRQSVGSGLKALTTADGRLKTAVADAEAPDGGSDESGRCAWIAGGMVGQEADGPVEPAYERHLIGRPLDQELEFRLGRVAAGEHRAAGGAAAHAGVLLRLLLIAASLSVPARSTMRQRKRTIERERIGIRTSRKGREQGLDHEQIGRGNRDPASRL